LQSINFINKSFLQKKNSDEKQSEIKPLYPKKQVVSSKLSFKSRLDSLTRSAFQTECEIRTALSEASSGNNPVLKSVKLIFNKA